MYCKSVYCHFSASLLRLTLRKTRAFTNNYYTLLVKSVLLLSRESITLRFLSHSVQGNNSRQKTLTLFGLLDDRLDNCREFYKSENYNMELSLELFQIVRVCLLIVVFWCNVAKCSYCICLIFLFNLMMAFACAIRTKIEDSNNIVFVLINTYCHWTRCVCRCKSLIHWYELMIACSYWTKNKNNCSFHPSSGSGLPGFSLLTGAGERWKQVCPVPEDGSREWSECSSRCF